MEEASLHTLFAVILTWCEPSNPMQIYENHKEAMAEDFLHQQHTQHQGLKSDATGIYNTKIWRLWH